MRIRRLKIQNLTTITDAELDFTSGPLAEQSLFLITGPTGSGKTSILDAITLALFSRAARFKGTKSNKSKSEDDVIYKDTLGELGDNSGENDIRRLVRRGADKCEIKLSFEGNDGCEYTAVWMVKKNRNGKFKEVERSLITNNDIIEGKAKVENAIKGIINITFDEFCRTTMLAQGDFTKFLRSNSDEKSKILSRILNANIYEQIGQRVFNKEKESKSAVNAKEIAIDQIKVMTDEEAKSAQTSLASKQTDCASKKARVSELKIKEDWLKKESANRQKLAKNKDEVAKAKDDAASPAMSKIRAAITLWDKTENIRGLMAEQRRYASELCEEKKKNENYANEFDNLQSALAARQKTVEALTNELAAAENAVRKAIDACGENCPQTKEGVTEAIDNSVKTIQKIGIAKTAIDLLRNATNDLGNKEAETKRCTEELIGLNDALKKAAQNKDKAQQAADKAKEEYDLIVQKCGHAAEVIAMLHEGDKCPICGGTIGHLTAEDEFEKIKAPLAKANNEAKETLSKATKDYAELKARRDASERLQKTSSAETAKAQKTCEKRRRDVEAAMADCGIAPDQAQQGVEVTARALDAQEKSENQRVESLRKLQSCMESQKEAERNLKILKQQSDDALSLHDDVLAACAGWRSRPVEDLADNLGVNIASKWTQFATNVKNWKERIIELKEHDAINRKQIETALAEEKVEEGDVTRLMAEYSNEDIKTARSRCAEADRRLASAQRILADTQKEADELAAIRPAMRDGDTLDAISEEAAKTDREIDTLNREIGTIEANLKMDSSNKREREKLENELATLSAKHKQWEILSNLFGDKDGKVFRTMALSYIFEELLHYANEHLRQLTANRFTLETQGSLAIAIRDAYHCDAIQTPTNLSGGESFMVSLSLALGLASMSRTGNSASDVLFIDEGFGTLDDEYLEKVMTMLEQLRERGGKRVGIISHVEALRERIPAQVRVERMNGSQSKVTVVG